MALWPFGKKNSTPGGNTPPAEPAQDAHEDAALRADADATPAVEEADAAVAAGTPEVGETADPVSIPHDAVAGARGRSTATTSASTTLTSPTSPTPRSTSGR